MHSTTTPLSPTDRTRVNRGKKRARTDRSDLYDVLDAGLVCHLGVVVDGAPMVVPTAYGRIGDTLYLHGSTGARSLRAGGEVCVTVTLVDGLVLARSVFHHSMNYRSAMVYGQVRRVDDPAEREAGLTAIVDHAVPGQWAYARRPSTKELAATIVLALSLEEASVKARSGAPVDDDADYDLPVWAGVVPVAQVRQDVEPDPRLAEGITVPAHIRAAAGAELGAELSPVPPAAR
ncbi:pyridoxamine 5'-phosphate oxidase family protein [Kineosporia sp. J2-2]|uniref:Pyridoxamine 5'-phosphate oxidase family protein n=1 Tax=Kineosporia corallincola TaxID=2835133 RepID=A0ABS5TCH1_9ACTN|nr:pyridoxamine 5'-phosphate oxidase family protein [Kineosporia corallincola]MBT0768780.1 pyridoxamine 5'-phosphate oxidase family protein [Kineosporia corallincola]